MKPSVVSSLVFAFCRVVGSAIDGRHSEVRWGLEGNVGGLDDDLGESAGESMEDAENYGAPGIVWRERAAEELDGTRIEAEAVTARTARGMTPLAWRDLRWHRRFPNPKPGSVAVVGYGGGFLSFDDTAQPSGSEKATLQTLYCPYDYVGGVPQKAHAIFLNPEDESVAIVHGDGAQFVMQSGKEITASCDNSTWLQLKPGQCNIQADQIALIGTVSIGDPQLAVALLGGAASQPSGRLFITTP